MNTPAFISFMNYLEISHLTDGYKLQMVQWEEQPDDKGTMKYMVFQPNGGSGRVYDIRADDTVMLTLVSAKKDALPVIERSQEILDYVTEHPIDPCLNSVFNLGGIPSPIPTQAGRVVVRLLFRCTA